MTDPEFPGDENFRLECDCHDMRCFIGFAFYLWEPFAGRKDVPKQRKIPNLNINVQWHPGNLWKRLGKAWRVIRRNEWHENADVEINDYRKIETLRDFLNRCLANEGKPE